MWNQFNFPEIKIYPIKIKSCERVATIKEKWWYSDKKALKTYPSKKDFDFTFWWLCFPTSRVDKWTLQNCLSALLYSIVVSEKHHLYRFLLWRALAELIEIARSSSFPSLQVQPRGTFISNYTKIYSLSNCAMRLWGISQFKL